MKAKLVDSAMVAIASDRKFMLIAKVNGSLNEKEQRGIRMAKLRINKAESNILVKTIPIL